MSVAMFKWKAWRAANRKEELLSVRIPHSRWKVWLAAKVAAALDWLEEFLVLVELFRRHEDEPEEGE